VLVFPAGSVTVMVVGVPSNCPTPVPAVAVQVTVPDAVAGDGVQLNPGIERMAPDSTLVIESITVSPVFAGFGVMVPTVGVAGGVASIVRVTVPVDEFPARSVIVRVGLDPMLFPVPVQVTVPPVLGDGVQVVPGIEIVAPDSTSPVVMVMSVVAVAGDGEAVVDGTDGGVVSTTRLHIFEAKF
jgi:hypothetical protein